MLKHLFSVLLATTFVLSFLTGCGGASSDGSSLSSGGGSSHVVPASLSLETIDDESFNALSEEDKLYIARKLYSTIYKGVEYKKLKEQIDSGKFISDFSKRLYANVEQPDLTKMKAYMPYDPSLEAHDYQQDRTEKYADNIKNEINSRLYCTKMGRKYFDEWIAYVLTQTILFSPAREVDSVTPFPEFIRNVYYRLVNRLDEGKSVKEIVYEHMISKENWGRFRSPEDNGREMLEIWLRNFKDEPVPIAAKALQNWKFDNYYSPEKKWVVYDFYHDEPGVDLNESVELFGFTLKNGYDFFKMVTEHPDFMPTVVSRIVDYFFPTMSESERAAITEKILQNKPETFQQIFAQILFSKKYLFESDKVKSVEETFYPMAQSLPYVVSKYFWLYKFEKVSDLANQKTMWNKLGRDDDLPTDTLSINYYYRYVRNILIELAKKPENLDDRLDKSTMESYVESMFLEVLGRHVGDIEKRELIRLAKSAGWDNKFDSTKWPRYMFTRLLLDYIGRLTEVYRYKRIEGAGK